jgi:putative endonuclease
MQKGFVYIITNKHHTTLYVDMTSMLYTRTKKHREKFYPKSFSARYNISKLVYYEVLESTAAARQRELQLKAGSRKRKIALIDEYNPEWRDLFEVISNENWDGAALVPVLRCS